ncbi:MAG TPA: protoporphyrinogen oxidase [Gemmatimonadaceae bacterium]|nr:protoporphyrinogen oxidase [Gemmatimonadaceae bacterium]
MTRHVVVIGGGISGLTALEQLVRRAPDVRVTLLEGSSRLGGHIRTERRDGYIMEAGPDVLLAAKPAAVDLARRVGLGERLRGTNPAVKGSYILSGTRLLRMPEGLTGLVPSRVRPFVTTPLISPLGKLRVGLDYLIPAARDGREESIEAFVTRRLGREMYERLVEPLLSGISAGDGARLSMQAMFPQLLAWERDHGGLIRGMLASRRSARAQGKAPGQGTRPAPMGFVSFPTGLEELPEAVARYARGQDASGGKIEIRVGTAVRRVARARNPSGALGFSVELSDGGLLDADAVVVATPAYISAGLLRSMDAGLAQELDGIEYGSTVTVSLSYPASAVPRTLDATGYVVPRVLKRPVLACTWVSAKFEARAPQGQALFRVFLGGVGRGSWVEHEDRDIEDLVRHEMQEIMGITAAPQFVDINRYHRAMPQYNVGHLDRVSRIEQRAGAIPGLALAGAAFRGVGIPDCVQSGLRAADAVLAHLGLDAARASATPAGPSAEARSP